MIENGKGQDTPKPKSQILGREVDAAVRAFGGLIDLTGKAARRGRMAKVRSVRTSRLRTLGDTGLGDDVKVLRKEATRAWTAEVLSLPSARDSERKRFR